MPTIETILEAAKSSAPTRQGRNWAENMLWCAEYAEPGYDDPKQGICLANWNAIDQYNRETKSREVIDDTPKRVGDLLERIGVDLQWEDEWSLCHCCSRAVRTQPDGWSWTPSYRIVDECELLCLDCFKSEGHDQSEDESEEE